jgi:hypothetical protein
MKKSFLTVLLVVSIACLQAQPWESFELTDNGDTINCVDQKQRKQGKWLVRVAELRGEPGYEEEGTFRDGLKEGVWRRFNLQGDMTAIENYKRGYRDGKQQYFTMLGELLREESWKAVDPDNPYDTIDVPDLYNPMVSKSKVIRLEGTEVRHGAWKYFDPVTGTLVKTENYISGQKEKPLANGNASAQPGTVGDGAVPAKAKPSAVQEWEKKNAGKKKVSVRDGRTGG